MRKRVIIFTYWLFAVPIGVWGSIALSGCSVDVPLKMTYDQVLITFVDLTPQQMHEYTKHRGCIKGYITEPQKRPGESFVRSTVYTVPPAHWGDDERIYTIGHEVVHTRGANHPKGMVSAAAGACP